MSTVRLRGVVVAVVLGAWVPAVAGQEKEDPLREQARKLNDLDTVEKMQAKLTELLKDKEAARKLLQAAVEIQQRAPEGERPFDFGAALVLAKVAHNIKTYDAAELFYNAAIRAAMAGKKPDATRIVQAYEGLLDAYFEQKKWQAAFDLTQRFIDLRGGEAIDQAKPFMLERHIQAKAKMGDTDEALRMAEGLVQLDKGGWYFLQLKGWVQREAGNIEDAIDTYKEVVERIQENKDLKEDQKTRLSRNVRYMLTGLYVDNKKIDEAAEILQKLIKEDPDNPTYYNDLGFIWADHDKNLEESEKLIRKALELDAKQREKLLADPEKTKDLPPDAIARLKQENAAYLDSLGWVLYKQKQYDEAEKYLRKAAEDEEDGHHVEIWDHLAEALIAQGKKKEALEVWQKALKFEDVSPRDVERKKKVTQKLNKLRAELREKK